MCAYTNVNKCCGFNKIIIIIQTFCCNRMWLHEMSWEKCFYHYRTVADSQVSSGQVTIKEGCRKRHFWYKSQGSSHFACFKLSGHFPSQAVKRVTGVSGFLQGLQTVPKPAQLQANVAPGREASAAASSPHQQGWPPLLGLHTSPLHCFPLARQKEHKCLDQSVKSDSSDASAGASALPPPPARGWAFPSGATIPSCVTIYERMSQSVVLPSLSCFVLFSNWRIIQFYNVVLVSAKHQHESATGIPMSPSSPLCFIHNAY